MSIKDLIKTNHPLGHAKVVEGCNDFYHEYKNISNIYEKIRMKGAEDRIYQHMLSNCNKIRLRLKLKARKEGRKSFDSSILYKEKINRLEIKENIRSEIQKIQKQTEFIPRTRKLRDIERQEFIIKHYRKIDAERAKARIKFEKPKYYKNTKIYDYNFFKKENPPLIKFIRNKFAYFLYKIGDTIKTK